MGRRWARLAVVPPPGEPLRPADRALLFARLAEQCGVALANLRLAAAAGGSLGGAEPTGRKNWMPRSRRLVTARDIERRRLSEEIERRIGPSLDAVETWPPAGYLGSSNLGRAGSGAELERLRSVTTEALEELRAMARGLYPPLLADKGLVAALEAEARKLTPPVRLRSRLGRDREGSHRRHRLLLLPGGAGGCRAQRLRPGRPGAGLQRRTSEVAMDEVGPGPGCRRHEHAAGGRPGGRRRREPDDAGHGWAKDGNLDSPCR